MLCLQISLSVVPVTMKGRWEAINDFSSLAIKLLSVASMFLEEKKENHRLFSEITKQKVLSLLSAQ